MQNISNFKDMFEKLDTDKIKTMLLFSPNNFDQIIATYGVENGNQILEQAHSMLQLNSPTQSELFILDCGEACIVLDEISSAKALSLAQQIQAFFHVMSIEVNSIKIKISLA